MHGDSWRGERCRVWKFSCFQNNFSNRALPHAFFMDAISSKTKMELPLKRRIRTGGLPSLHSDPLSRHLYRNFPSSVDLPKEKPRPLARKPLHSRIPPFLLRQFHKLGYTPTAAHVNLGSSYAMLRLVTQLPHCPLSLFLESGQSIMLSGTFTPGPLCTFCAAVCNAHPVLHFKPGRFTGDVIKVVKWFSRCLVSGHVRTRVTWHFTRNHNP